ncbi:hypothetical protein [Lentilactobacillus kosonis]|uniref:Uncharacterized protein n=1 Tax=Lentilactobacillus kosonis TaxID=2810561 RepID=A0A401FP42_9LACO|nr:hypothetical protein [Lentilactobacillus kosonis]GAY74150.1 hypothetical protein NBRC111893_2296 [Lentilactobacillus kosonis]
MNLDEFVRATNSLNPTLILLVAKGQHFEPVTQISLIESTIFLQTKADSPSINSTLNLNQFIKMLKKVPNSYDIRFFNTKKLVFGFRIIDKTLVFY